jgi:uncharacterized membrane protein YhaH (DUF805 family)
VGFGHWYLRRGRIDRRTWWLHYTLPFALLNVLAVLADWSFGSGPQLVTQGGAATPGALSLGPLATVVGLLTLVPTISATVCRLHDRNQPALWLLLLFVPVVGQLVLFGFAGFVPGTPGPNRYGPPPSWLAPRIPDRIPPGWA